ncbi:MAG TPA: nucleoside transporter C-terminal domain-containing protein, partial [Polyangia bacterium]|nr:nucleoside transporter C-terminal domain-containing protein [Polyangia bacterium]
HLLTAVIMTAPGTILASKMLVPETEVPLTAKRAGSQDKAIEEESGAEAEGSKPAVDIAEVEEYKSQNFLAAIAKGTTDGLNLALNVGAMLIAFVALVTMVDNCFSAVGGLFGHAELTLGRILGFPLTPLAFCMGVPWSEAPFVGSLLGTKTVLNEFLAYQMMTHHVPALSAKSLRIASFALCGFANFGSLAIVLGGLGSMVPERRADLARLGPKSILAGSLATFLTGTIAGLIGP